MSYDIRPLSFGEVLDESFKLLRDQFAVLVGICAVLYVPMSLLQSLLVPDVEQGVPTPPSFAFLGVGVLLGILSLLVVLPLTQLAVTRAVSAAYLSAPLTLGEAYGGAYKLYGKYLITVTLVGVLGTLSFLLLIVPGIYFMVCWSLVGPVFVVEGLMGGAALRRSRALVRGHFGRVLGVVLVAGLGGGIVGAGVEAVLGSIPFLGPVLVGGVQAIVAAFGEIVVVVLYVDLRCRAENFDLERLANAVMTDGAAAPPPAATES